MIKPTIGRVVWYRDRFNKPEEQPQVALICYVHSDNLVNLIVFDHDGNPVQYRSVLLWQGEGNHPSLDFCEWMPYQIGQAKAAAAV